MAFSPRSVLSCVKMWAFTDRFHSDSAFVCARIRANFSELCTILFNSHESYYTTYVGAQENYTKSNNITKLSTEL